MIQPRFIFITLSLLASYSVAYEDADLIKVAHSIEWKRLLHYEKESLSGENSLIDGPGFFFSEKGKSDLLAELIASIAGLKNTELRVGPLKNPTYCAFPARRKFLEQKLKIEFPKQSCEKLDKFMAQFDEPVSVSVVFSSAYPNNPASMFGHTFLKINSKSKADLKNVGINFAAAVPPEENSFAFIYFGVFGGYPGQWSTLPFHSKVKEYIQSENRDLWEYELNLTPQETTRLINHIWELETNGYFDYYFFDENCSYQILAAIEAIKPNWDLTEHTIYFIPGESVKNLFTRGDIVKNVIFRPSIQRQALQKYQALNSDEKKQLLTIMNDRKVNDSVSTLTLNAAIDYYQFLDIKQQGQLSKKDREVQLKILSTRAKRGVNTEKESLPPIVAETRPDQGHDSYSIQVSQGVRDRELAAKKSNITRFKIKSAYHDLMNNDKGYKRYSHIDFPAVEFQYDSELNELRLEGVTALAITSLPPMNFLSYSPSWKMETGLYTARDYGCLNCRHVFQEVGAGGSVNIWSKTNIAYVLAILRGELYHNLNRGYRYGPGFEAGFIMNPLEDFKFRLSFKQFWDIDQKNRSDILQDYLVETSYFAARNWEIRGTFNMQYPLDHPDRRYFIGSIGFIYFFN